MKKVLLISMILFGTAVNADGDMTIGTTNKACQASHGGKCIQEGDSHSTTVHVQHADRVCQATSDGQCYQTEKGKYNNCTKENGGGYTCWD